MNSEEATVKRRSPYWLIPMGLGFVWVALIGVFAALDINQAVKITVVAGGPIIAFGYIAAGAFSKRAPSPDE